jgi:hypothetical protein
MSLSNYRTADPIFTAIYRDPSARDRLTQWATTSRAIQARVEDNRMHMFDYNTLSLFIVTWTHAWDNMVIWDPWLKRHITW